MYSFIKYSFLFAFTLFFFINLSAQNQKKSKTETATFSVKGNCGECKDRIENAALIKGVKLTEWDNDAQLLTVIYRPDKTTLEQVQQAVAESGHQTKDVDANKEAYKKLPKCCQYETESCGN